MPFRIQVVLVTVICAAAGTLVRPYWGLLFLIFLTFTRPQDDRPNVNELHIPLIMTTAVIVSTLGRAGFLLSRLGLVIRRLALFFALFALMILAAFANGMTTYSVVQLDDTLTVVIVCSLILIWVNSQERLKAFLFTLLLAGLYYVRMVIRDPRIAREEIAGDQFERLSYRNVNNFGNPNFLAMLMAILLFLALALFVYEKRIWFKAGFAGLAAGFLYAFLRCQSRGASLGLAAGLFIFWLMQRRKLLVATILVATGILGILVLAPTSYLDRLQTITNYQEDKSAMGRLEMWQISLGLIARNPVVGIGPANFAPRFPHMSQHNAYLQVASEVGIPALLLYVALLVSGYRALWVARKLASPARRQMPYLYKISEGILCALIAITVQGFVTGFAFREFVYITLTLAYCVRELAESGPSPEDLTPSQAAAPADYAPA